MRGKIKTYCTLQVHRVSWHSPTYLAAATLLPFIVLPLLVTLFCLSFHNSSYSVMLSKMDYHLVADQINGPDIERLMKLDLAIRRKVILKVKLSI